MDGHGVQEPPAMKVLEDNEGSAACAEDQGFGAIWT